MHEKELFLLEECGSSEIIFHILLVATKIHWQKKIQNILCQIKNVKRKEIAHKNQETFDLNVQGTPCILQEPEHVQFLQSAFFTC